jgi:hypothetical protein
VIDRLRVLRTYLGNQPAIQSIDFPQQTLADRSARRFGTRVARQGYGPFHGSQPKFDPYEIFDF